MPFCPISAYCLALGLAINVIRVAGGRAGALRPLRQDLGPPVGGLDLAHQGAFGEKIFWPNGLGFHDRPRGYPAAGMATRRPARFRSLRVVGFA